MTSAMSARMSRRVTAESRARAALTMVPRLTEEHGSSANSDEAMRIVSPAEEEKEEKRFTISVKKVQYRNISIRTQRRFKDKRDGSHKKKEVSPICYTHYVDDGPGDAFA